MLIGNIEVPPDIIEQKLEPVIDKLAEQFETMNQRLFQETNVLVTRIQATLKIFEELEDSAVVLNGGVIRDRFSEVREQVDQNLTGVGTRFARNLETATREIGEASAAYQRSATQAFQGFDQRLQAPVGTVNARLAQVSSSFESLSNKITRPAGRSRIWTPVSSETRVPAIRARADSCLESVDSSAVGASQLANRRVPVGNNAGRDHVDHSVRAAASFWALPGEGGRPGES